MKINESNSNLPPLSLSEKDMRAIMGSVGNMIVDHFVNLPHHPVTRPSTVAGLRQGLAGPPPVEPTPVAELLSQIQNYVMAEMTHNDHPRNFAFVPGPSNFVSVMADALASAFNIFCGAWIGPSGTAQVELITIDWLRQLFGFPETAGGLFVSGGSMANLTGLAVARQVKLGSEVAGGRIYFSDQTHSSVAKGLRILGFQADQLHKLASDANYCLPMTALKQAVASDRKAGHKPFCVVANAGTTNSGAVDPLNEIADFCSNEGFWLHVDGAYGGSAALSASGAKLLEGMDRADSLSIDPHKWMFQPYEIGCALIRDQNALRETFKVSAEYLKIVEESAEQPNFSDYGVQLTRGFRALKLWMSLKAFGVEAFRSAIERGIANALRAEKILRAQTCWEIVTPAQLGIVTFRFIAPGFDEAWLNKLNSDIATDMITSGFALLSPTVMRGQTVLRMCTINPRTTDDDIGETIKKLENIAHQQIALSKLLHPSEY